MNEVRCGNCAYWTRSNSDNFGNCGRYPPTVKDPQQRYSKTVWPITTEGALCGEWASKKSVVARFSFMIADSE